MFRLDEPATWPQEGDRLWLPWVSPIAFTVAGCKCGPNGKPLVKFVDGTVDDLIGWQYYPKQGDHVIVATRPLYRIYHEHSIRDSCDQLLEKELDVIGPGSRPPEGSAASCPRPFLRLIPVDGGDPVNLPDVCCIVIGGRHG